MNEPGQYRLLINLAIPAILSQVSHTLVGLADTVMIGKTGNVTALAASALANNVLSVPIVFLVGISYAITPKVSEYSAQGKKEACCNLLKQSLINNLGWAILICSFLTFLLPYSYNLEQQKEVLALAIPFFGYLIASLPGLVIFQSFRQFYDGLGNTKPGMVASLLANLLNVFLNYLLIYGKLGFPEMGLIGAGISNFISRWLMGIGLLIYFLLEPGSKEWRQSFGSFAFDLEGFKLLNRLGVPISFQFLFEVGAFSFTALLVGRMGEVSLAAHQIVITMASMTYMMASGLAAAATIRVGHFVGLKDKKMILLTGRNATVLVVLFMGSTAFLFLFFKHEIPILFIEKMEVGLAAGSLLVIAGLFQISDGVQVVFLGCLRGLSDVKIPTIITFIAYWAIAIPLGYYLGLVLNFGLNGTWWGLLAGLSVSAFFMLIRFYYLVNRINFEN
jgi:MATE family multidrug resistance protein